jgi:hypothetical protein
MLSVVVELAPKICAHYVSSCNLQLVCSSTKFKPDKPCLHVSINGKLIVNYNLLTKKSTKVIT